MNARVIPVIETPRLTLTLPGPEAAPQLVDYFTRNREHLRPWEPPFTRAMFTTQFWQRRLTQNQGEYRSGHSMRMVVFRSRELSGPAIGMANFNRFAHGVFMACTLGYSIDKEVEGQGMMSEALRGGIRYAFDTLNMHRVMANYIPTNERSGRLLRKLGFVVEGYARDYLYINGAWRDHILTALTNPGAPIPEYVRMARAEQQKEQP